MKSLLLSQKRNPDDKIEKTLDKKNVEENADKEKNVEEKEKDKEKEVNKEPNNETSIPLDENKDKENKEETPKEKKSKKRIKKSLKRNNNKTKDEKQENENKEKDENNNNKQKQTNKRIGDYFLLSGKKEQNIANNPEENKELNNAENNINNPEENLIKELMPKDPLKELTNYINKEEIFSLDTNNKTKYDTSYINEIKEIPDKIKDFYKLNSSEINSDNKNEYISTLKNYFTELNSLNNANKQNNTNITSKKNKLIFIHNSFAPLKKIPTRESNLINPRNFLAKDDYLIDYEKDSEDEYMEENAEDIKSNDNEDKEEDEEDDINSIQDDKFIVPDGHLSEEELSDKDMMKERQLLENSKENLLGIMSILNIRRNFMKPIVVDFKNKKTDDKINYLMDQLTIGLFKYEDENINNENINTNNIDENNINNNINIYEENELKPNKVALSFPIVIGSKVTKYKGIEDSIKIHFEDILRKVHGSYDTKEHLILQLNKKFEDISKKSLNTFFKEKCFKIQKKYWMVNNDTLSQFNIKEEELEKIKKDNFNIYKEKEEKRKKELEEIKIKDGIIQPPPNPTEEIKEENNDESHISHNNSNIIGEKNDKEANESLNDNNAKNKSRSKNASLNHKFKSKTKSRKRNDTNNEGYKMKQLEVLFKESAEAQKNIKVENDNKEQPEQNTENKKKETLKIFDTIKMTEEERQKDLLEIPVINYREENNEDKEMKDAVEEENKKPKRKRKENKEKIQKSKSKEPTKNKSKSKSKSKSNNNDKNKKGRKRKSKSKMKDKEKNEMMEEIKEEKEENEDKEEEEKDKDKDEDKDEDKKEKSMNEEDEKENKKEKKEKKEKNKKEKSKKRRAKSQENKTQKKSKSKKNEEEKTDDKNIDEEKKEEKSKKKERKQKREPKEEKEKKQKEKNEKIENKSKEEEKSFTKSKSQTPFNFSIKYKAKEIVQHNQSTIDAFINNKQ